MIRTLSSAALASLLLSSCIAVIDPGDEAVDGMHAVDQDGKSAQPAAGQADEAAQAEEPEELDLEPLEWAVSEAEAGLEKATLSASIDLLEGEERLTRARVELEDARADLEHFDAYTAPTELAERTLSLDRSKARLFEAQAELQQLLDMYADEEFATSSKELVIERGRRGVDQQERSLALAEAALADLEAFDLAKRRTKLERAVEKADMDLLVADRRLAVKRLDWLQDERGLQRKLAKAQEALAEARAKLEAGEAVAAN